MIVSKSKKRHYYKLFQRKSLLVHFKSEHRLKHHLYFPEEKFSKKSRIRYLMKNFRQTYRSLCLTTRFIFRLFVFIDKITREIFILIEKILQIIKVIHGWICMIRSILSAIHLIINRFMLLLSYIHRIFYLLTILFEPFSNRTFEKFVRSFSYFLFYYYSSNGACYTLQDRTRHIVNKVRARWKRKNICLNDDDDEIYYDAFSEECEWS